MHPLVGYCDRWSAKPGQSVKFMVSSSDPAPFDVRFVRHLCADPNPAGPGYREIAMASPVDGSHFAPAQAARRGSFGAASGLAVQPDTALAIGATVWPTLPQAGRQGVVALAAAGWRILLGFEGGRAFAEVSAADGRRARAAVDAPMLARRWYDLALLLHPGGRLQLAQRPRSPLGRIVDAGMAEAAGPAPAAGVCDVLLAALPGDDGHPGAHLNGKLERPTLWAQAASLEAVLDAQRGAAPDAPGLIACWDFSVGMQGNTARDIGPAHADARLAALPMRAMTGSGWTGAVHDWKQAPEQYGAIHFHADDQGDLGWEPAFTLVVPEDWPSGFYAANLSRGADQDYIPFFVRPASPRARVAFLVPTFSYQVYGCYVRPGRGAEIRDRAEAWGALPQTPDMNPDFGLSTYNHHADGSGVAVASMNRPMLDTRPRQMSLMDPAPDGSGTGRVCADSYFIDWLDRLGIECDVVTDHDLHAEGLAAIAPYRVLIAGQHPEYHSERMMQALEDYLSGAGRLMYLGGNGFYWRAEPSAADPHALEVRRAEGGIRVWAAEPGESYHAFGGGYGGLWRRIGRSSHRLVGISFSVQGRHLGFPYRFTEAIADPRVAFMTAGLAAEPGGVFGETGFMGGGAAGFELDSVDPHWGTPPNALVVAKGIVIDPDYGPVNEDMLVLRHPKRQEDWSCADMVFFETAAGGAVFSVGSMTFAGSLPVAACGNTASRLTANVLRRFLDPAPFA